MEWIKYTDDFILLIIALLTLYNTISFRGTKRDIKLLETNTNSIKDALVKVTGEAAHAEGKLEGIKQEQDKKSS